MELLFDSLRLLQAQRWAGVFLSHKLNEVMSLTQRVTVLAGGKVAGTVQTKETTPAQLARMMVGRETFGVNKNLPGSSQASGKVALRLENLAALDNKGLPALKNISLEVQAGEIVGLAGVSGNGQSELAQVLAGTRPCTGGRITVQGRDVTNADPTTLMAAGFATLNGIRT